MPSIAPATSSLCLWLPSSLNPPQYHPEADKIIVRKVPKNTRCRGSFAWAAHYSYSQTKQETIQKILLSGTQQSHGFALHCCCFLLCQMVSAALSLSTSIEITRPPRHCWNVHMQHVCSAWTYRTQDTEWQSLKLKHRRFMLEEKNSKDLPLVCFQAIHLHVQV